MDLPIAADFRRYFKSRSEWFSAYSDFNYCNRCDARCCKDPIQVTIKATDIVGIALETDRSPSYIAEKARGAVNNELSKVFRLGEGVFPLALELPKPCPLLDGDKCSVYQGRPISCAIYPEARYLDARGTDGIPEDHPCREGQTLSEKRKRIVNRIGFTLIKEMFASDIFLFGVSPQLIDMRMYDNHEGSQIAERVARQYCQEKNIQYDEFLANRSPGAVNDELRNRLLQEVEPIRTFNVEMREKVCSLETEEGLRSLHENLMLLEKLTRERKFDPSLGYVKKDGELVPICRLPLA